MVHFRPKNVYFSYFKNKNRLQWKIVKKNIFTQIKNKQKKISPSVVERKISFLYITHKYTRAIKSLFLKVFAFSFLYRFGTKQLFFLNVFLNNIYIYITDVLCNRFYDEYLNL